VNLKAPGAAPPLLGLGSGLDGVLDQGYRKLASTVSGELKKTVDAMATAARGPCQSAIPPWLAQEIEADRARMQTLVDMAAGHAARADRTQRDLAAAPRDARALAAQVEAMRDEQMRERETLTSQLEALRHEQAGERARLTAELVSTREELARITAKLAEVPHAEAALRGELSQTQRELNDERASIAKLTDALETARREADGHQIRFDSARHHLERFALEIEEARATLSAREDLCAKLASEVDGLRVREADLKRERDTLRHERDDAPRALERRSASTKSSASSARRRCTARPPSCRRPSRSATSVRSRCPRKPTGWPTRSPKPPCARPASRSSSRCARPSSRRCRSASTTSSRACARWKVARSCAPPSGSAAKRARREKAPPADLPPQS
jgi:hypothetical protein